MGKINVKLAEIMLQHNIKQVDLAAAAHLRYATLNTFFNGQAKGVDYLTLAKTLEGLRRLSGQNYDVGDLLKYEE